MIFQLFKDRLINKFKDRVFLSSIGARICYNKSSIKELLTLDERVNTRKERAKFLKKLAFKYYHTSIFAHTFAYFEITDEVIDNLKSYPLCPIDFSEVPKEFRKPFLTSYLASIYFKSEPVYDFLEDRYWIGLSLRHFIEEVYLTDDLFIVGGEKTITELFEQASDFDVEDFVGWEDYISGKSNVVKLHHDRNLRGYVVYLVDDISRTCSHQIVRHTKLNFSQRSQRYVKEDNNNFVYPPNLTSEAKDFFEIIYKDLTKKYNKLVNQYKVKKEDARYILPNGKSTTLLISGTQADIIDFIGKRNIPQAQWEIRQVAGQMEKLFNIFRKS